MDLKQLKKVELHAHLSGSIGKRYLTERFKLEENYLKDEDVFETFPKLHTLLDSIEEMSDAFDSFISDLVNENVIYCEVRTTLRPIPTLGDHLEALYRVVRRNDLVRDGKIQIRLLPSIDRGAGVEGATRIKDTILKSYQDLKDLVVGVDLSGNPLMGSLKEYASIMNELQRNGIPTTVHLAEIDANPEDWIDFLLEHTPNRIGHGTFIYKHRNYNSQARMVFERIIAQRIPIEICLKSNLTSRSVKRLEEHHFVNWYLELKHPVCICTDDQGVFETNLTAELSTCREHYSLTIEDIVRLQEEAIDHSFVCATLAASLKEKLRLKDPFQ